MFEPWKPKFNQDMSGPIEFQTGLVDGGRHGERSLAHVVSINVQADNGEWSLSTQLLAPNCSLQSWSKLFQIQRVQRQCQDCLFSCAGNGHHTLDSSHCSTLSVISTQPWTQPWEHVWDSILIAWQPLQNFQGPGSLQAFLNDILWWTLTRHGAIF